ncbi:hypothetical protein KBB41_00435 [Candidatus Curtissbacteria bacterium]|nr:hypothetical protein [Candidatus Curtissbacteria bacterium]
MFSEIVVLSHKTGFNSKTYTYKNPPQPPTIGQLVKIPFGQKTYFGIVTSLTKTSKRPKLKTIEKIYGKTPLITPNQIIFFQKIADHYRGNISDILKFALPPIPVRQLKLLDQKIIDSPKQNINLIITASENQFPNIISRLKPKSKITIFNSHDTPTQKLKNYFQILHNNTDTIITTRSGILLPFQSLETITIYDEEDISYQEERAPYYNCVKAAEIYCQLFPKTKLNLISHSPSLTSFYSRKSVLTIKPIVIPTNLKIVKINPYEKYETDSAFFTKIAQESINDNLGNNKSILIFLNKTSPKGFLYCQSCQYKKFVPTATEDCPNCHSPRIRFFSPNLNSLQLEISKKYPKTKISIIDSKTKPDLRSNIFLGTKSSLYVNFPEKLGLIIVINTDDIFYPYNYNSEIAGFQTLRKIISIPSQNYILQAKNPDNYLIDQTITPSPNAFLSKQLKLRQAFDLPPFSHSLTLSIQGKNLKLLKNKSQKIIKLIKNQKTNFNFGEITAFQNSSNLFNIFIPVFHKDINAFDIIIPQLPSKTTVKINYLDTQ